MRLWGLEWLSIVVEEIGRAGISTQKRNALRVHLEMDLGQVMGYIKRSLEVYRSVGMPVGVGEEVVKEAEAACRCAESWIGYGLGAEWVEFRHTHLDCGH